MPITRKVTGTKRGKAVSEGLRIIDINIRGVFRIYISRVSAISFAWRIYRARRTLPRRFRPLTRTREHTRIPLIAYAA